MGKNKKKRVDIVYSTNPDYGYDHETDIEQDTLPPEEQYLTAIIDRKSRKGNFDLKSSQTKQFSGCTA